VCAHRGDCLSRSTANVCIEEHGRDGKIGFPQIVMDQLAVPAESSRLHLESEQRDRIEIVTGPDLASEIGAGISGDEVDQSERGIRGPRDPRMSASRAPDLGALRPSLVTRLT